MTIEELEAKLETVSRERDEAQSQHAIASANYVIAMDALETATRERDKFQAIAELNEGYRRERDESRAELERLTDERDELLVRVADQGAELRATREAYGTAYYRGAKATLGACVATIHDGGLVWTRESAERALRKIGILEEP
jgi:chromosome segregation ATPase